MTRKAILFFLISALFSCVNPVLDQSDTSEFVLKPNFGIELVAKEPLLNSPVAMTFDHKGRIWVVEMPGYMRDINGTAEEAPDGKIVILSDKDGDGEMDHRTIFLDGLHAPRALAFAYGGLLFTDTPKLFWVPIEQDRPGARELVDSLYVVGGNIEHRPNGLLYNVDNWFYSAKSNVRYRRSQGSWLREVTAFRGQWGISHDMQGRLFYNSNSNPLQCDQWLPNQLEGNPFMKTKVGANVTLDPERLMNPYQPTSVNRGYNPGVLDSLGRVQRFTSACGPVIYAGDQFPKEFQGNAFVCGPEGNLIKRYLLSEDDEQLNAESAYADSEFLVSTDESFRPVNLYNGPDGALYVVDLRKGIIQHRAYMSNYLREQILAKGLDSIVGKGRIYRIVATDHPQMDVPDWSRLRATDFVTLLQHPNGYVRDQAQQFLVFGDHSTLADQIFRVAQDTMRPFGQIHALWTLEGLGLLSAEQILAVARLPLGQDVMRHIFLLAEGRLNGKQILELVEFYMQRPGCEADLSLSRLAASVAEPGLDELWLQLAGKYSNNLLFCEALVSGAVGREEHLLSILPGHLMVDTIASVLKATIQNKELGEVQLRPLPVKLVMDGRTRGATLYSAHCATCHGLDAKGIDQLAPPLENSEFVSSSAERFILIALNGLQGPVTVAGKEYNLNLVMPGIKNNPELSDDDIAVLLKFIGNGFNTGMPGINAQMVKDLREKTEDRDDLFTVESLEDWMQENLDIKVERIDNDKVREVR